MEEDNNVKTAHKGKIALAIVLAFFVISAVVCLTGPIISDGIITWVCYTFSAVWVISGIMMHINSTVKENNAALIQELKAELQKDQAALRND